MRLYPPLVFPPSTVLTTKCNDVRKFVSTGQGTLEAINVQIISASRREAYIVLKRVNPASKRAHFFSSLNKPVRYSFSISQSGHLFRYLGYSIAFLLWFGAAFAVHARPI